jgi:hypothetical protein
MRNGEVKWGRFEMDLPDVGNEIRIQKFSERNSVWRTRWGQDKDIKMEFREISSDCFGLD